MADVSVSIGAVTSELKAGLGEAGDMLKDFRKESRQSARAANFFADKIADIGIASGGAGKALGQMLGGLAMGGAAGLAMGGLHALVTLIHEGSESSKEAARHAEEWKKQLRDVDATAEAAEKNLRKLDAVRRGMSTATAEAVYGGDQAKRDEALVAARERLYSLLKYEGREREAQVEQQDDLLLATIEEEALQAAVITDTAEIRDLKREIANIEAANASGMRVAHAEEQAAHRKASESLDVERAKLDGQVKLIGAFTDMQRVQIERDNTLAGIEARRKYAASQDDLDKLAQEAKAAKRIADEKLRVLQYDQEMAQQRAAILNKGEGFAELEAPAFAQNPLDSPSVTEAKRLAKEREKKELEERAKAYEQWGDKVGGALAAVFTKGASPAKAMVAILKDVTKAVLESAQKQIVASALGTGAKGAEAVAGTPFTGPAMAALAMSSLIGMVMALVSSLPSARGGMDLPDFTGGALAVLHGGEQVLPRELAQRIRSMSDDPQPARGRGEIVVNIGGALDGQSVERVFRDNDSAAARALRIHARRRRQS